eukprot:2555784-Rhodomonas_salina.1
MAWMGARAEFGHSSMGQCGTMCCDDQAAQITVSMGRQTGLEVAAISMGVTAMANSELSSCRTGRT